MYVCLNKEYLKKNQKNMEKEAKEKYDGSTNELLETELEETDETMEFSDGTFIITKDTPLGLFSLDIDINDDIAMQVVNHLKKKAEKVKELIKLAD